jgi:ribosome-associated protein
MTSQEPTLPSIHQSEQRVIRISSPPIRLGQFLKHTGIVQNGLEAKIKIQNGEVLVNGQLELRRGRQLCHGDRISTGRLLYIVECI